MCEVRGSVWDVQWLTTTSEEQFLYSVGQQWSKHVKVKLVLTRIKLIALDGQLLLSVLGLVTESDDFLLYIRIHRSHFTSVSRKVPCKYYYQRFKSV
jgi:hypothetical protein